MIVRTVSAMGVSPSETGWKRAQMYHQMGVSVGKSTRTASDKVAGKALISQFVAGRLGTSSDRKMVPEEDSKVADNALINKLDILYCRTKAPKMAPKR